MFCDNSTSFAPDKLQLKLLDAQNLSFEVCMTAKNQCSLIVMVMFWAE